MMHEEETQNKDNLTKEEVLNKLDNYKTSQAPQEIKDNANRRNKFDSKIRS